MMNSFYTSEDEEYDKEAAIISEKIKKEAEQR